MFETGEADILSDCQIVDATSFTALVRRDSLTFQLTSLFGCDIAERMTNRVGTSNGGTTIVLGRMLPTIECRVGRRSA
jgi:hypothetical protein